MTVPSGVGQRSLHALVVEDGAADAELVLYHIRKAGFQLTADVISTIEDMTRCLRDNDYDVIVCDYNLSGWSALEGLEIRKASGRSIPFIVVSGTIGDVQAVECIKQGATDYVLKNHMDPRLGITISRALREFATFREKAVIVLALEGSKTALQQAQKMDAVGQLAGGIAHDFNNLLSIIMGQAELLMVMDKPEAALHVRAEAIVKAAERGASLTGRLLAFGRKQTLNPAAVSMNDLVR